MLIGLIRRRALELIPRALLRPWSFFGWPKCSNLRAMAFGTATPMPSI